MFDGLNWVERSQLRRQLGFPADSRSAWQMDHATPVIEGGGMCGLEGLRTLCVPCHKRETKELAGRRAQQRKEAS